MRQRHRLGRQFGWLWGAYGTSALGTWLAFGAFPLIAIQVLHAGPAEVAALSSVGALAGAAVAVPLGSWVEFRRKRPVMVGTDLVRFVALLTIPAAFALGVLSFVQLLLVSVVVAAADITFRAASGAYLKTLLPAEDLLVANARFEATTWTTTIIGPPLGGAAVGILGPVATVLADALSHLLSALGIRAMGGQEPPPERREAARPRSRDLLDGWRYILADAMLRPLLVNTAFFNGLVMAADALLAVLMLGRLGFAPWQYGLAFAAPALGGLFGARLARPLVTRFGQHRVLVVAGTLRAIWPVGLAFVGPGTAGLLLVMGVQFGLVLCCGVFNPVCATYRLERTATGRVTRTLSAWSVTTRASTALLTAVWGVLGSLLGPRTAIGLAGLLLLATPLLLPRRAPASLAETKPAPPSSPKERTMTVTTPAVDPRTAALLVMDYQQAILASLPADPEALLSQVAGAISDMRAHGAAIAYVRVGFTEADWAAIPPANKAFSVLGRQRLMHHADPATDIHHRLAPEPGDITVRKTRFGALSTTDLDRRLRDRGITTLVVTGVATGGAVLSTVVEAADRDYRLYVLSDCVADPDPQTHQMLMTGILPRLAHIVDTAELRSLLKSPSPHAGGK